MPQNTTLRLRGRLTSLFDPRTVVITEEVDAGGVTLHMEKPRDDEFWADLLLSEEALERLLRAVRVARSFERVVREQEAGRRVADAAMPAWTIGRELA